MDGYNGYSNYETWNIVLWIYNDEGNYYTLRSYIRKQAGEALNADEAASICNRIFDDGLTSATPDGVWLDDKKIDWDEVASMLNEDFGLTLPQVN